MASSLVVKIGGVTIDAIRADTNFNRINEGHSQAIILVDNYGGQYNNDFDVDNIIEKYFENLLVFKGYLDNVKHVVSQEEQWSGRDLLRITGRDYSKEYSNLQLTKRYEVGTLTDDLIKDAMTTTGCTISYTSNHEAPALDAVYMADDESLINLIRNVLQRDPVLDPVWEGYVHTDKTLYLYGSPTSTTLTFSTALAKNFVEKDGIEIANRIKVYGKSADYPIKKDEWTDSLTSWSVTAGTGSLSLDSTTKQRGQYSIKYTAATASDPVNAFKRTISAFKILGKRADILNFWCKSSVILWQTDLILKLHCPDASNCYTYYPALQAPPQHYDECLFSVPLNYPISKVGSPDIDNVQAIEFYFNLALGNGTTLNIDELYFSNVRPYGVASDTTYSRRDLTMIKNNLVSDAECAEYANRQLALMKLPIKTINVTVPASDFISGGVWRGRPSYKLVLNFADLGISSQDYKITNLKLSIAPYENLKDGYDALATFDAIPLTAFHEWKNQEMTRTGKLIVSEQV